MFLIALTYGPVLFAIILFIAYGELKDVIQNNESKMSLALSAMLAITYLAFFVHSFV